MTKKDLIKNNKELLERIENKNKEIQVLEMKVIEVQTSKLALKKKYDTLFLIINNPPKFETGQKVKDNLIIRVQAKDILGIKFKNLAKRAVLIFLGINVPEVELSDDLYKYEVFNETSKEKTELSEKALIKLTENNEDIKENIQTEG